MLAPYKETAALCFDKYEMSKYLAEQGINTVKTFGCFADFWKAYNNKEIDFPVFVKPRTGSGSVGARKVETFELLEELTGQDETLIIQELMTGEDMDADIYVDTISHKPVAIFSKKKLSTTIGGANKTISFKDDALFEFVQNTLSVFRFNGPLDMAGVDFPKLIYTNVVEKKENAPGIGDYEENVVMMMYDSVVIKTLDEIQNNMVSL